MSIDIVNSVYRGSLCHRVDLKLIQQDLTLCLPPLYKITLYQRRPFMLCVQRRGACLTLFLTGRFRIMGQNGITLKVLAHWFRYVRAKGFTYTHPFLTLQTQTVKFRAPSQSAKLLLEHCKEDILYEPEIFSAIRIKRWSQVHINLFFTGNVIILGRCAYTCASEVCQWLENLCHEFTCKPAPPPSPVSKIMSDPLSDALDDLVGALPIALQEKGKSYFSSFPRRLVFSWHRRLRTNDSSLLPYLLELISQYSM